MTDFTYYFEYATIRHHIDAFKLFQKDFLEANQTLNFNSKKLDNNSIQLKIYNFIQRIGEASTTKKLLNSELDEILETLHEHQVHLMSLLKEFRSQFDVSHRLNNYSVALSNGINAIYGIRFVLEENLRMQKMSAMDRHITELSEKTKAIEALEKSLKEKYPTLEELITQEINKSQTKYSEFAIYIDQTTTNVQTLFSIASTEAIGKIFNKRSEEESKAANDFRLWSIIIMIAIFAMDLLFIYRGVLFGFTGLEAFSAVTLSLILLTPAIYLSKESTKHRKFEQENIKVSQNISAINSLIGPLKPDDKNVILRLIAESLLKNMQPAQLDDSSPNIQIAFGEKLLEKLKSSGTQQ